MVVCSAHWGPWLCIAQRCISWCPVPTLQLESTSVTPKVCLWSFLFSWPCIQLLHRRTANCPTQWAKRFHSQGHDRGLPRCLHRASTTTPPQLVRKFDVFPATQLLGKDPQYLPPLRTAYKYLARQYCPFEIAWDCSLSTSWFHSLLTCQHRKWWNIAGLSLVNRTIQLDNIFY